MHHPRHPKHGAFSFLQTRSSSADNAALAASNRLSLEEALSAVQLLQDGPILTGGNTKEIKTKDTSSVFLDRYKQILPEERLQAAHSAASCLSKQYVQLPPLEVDRSSWKKRSAASIAAAGLPARLLAPVPSQKDHQRLTAQEDGDDLQLLLAPLNIPNADQPLKAAPSLQKQRSQRKRQDAKLAALLGAALDKFLQTAGAKEAEEQQKKAQLLKQAAAEEARFRVETKQADTTAVPQAVSTGVSNDVGGRKGRVSGFGSDMFQKPPSQRMSSSGRASYCGMPSSIPLAPDAVAIQQTNSHNNVQQQPTETVLLSSQSFARSRFGREPTVFQPTEQGISEDSTWNEHAARASSPSSEKELIWDDPVPTETQQPCMRVSDGAGICNSNNQGFLETGAPLVPHQRALTICGLQTKQRHSLNGAVLAANAALGIAPRASYSGAPAAALAVFNSVTDHQPSRGPSRLGMTSDLRDPDAGSESDSSSDKSDKADKDVGHDEHVDPLSVSASLQIPTTYEAGRNHQQTVPPQRVSFAGIERLPSTVAAAITTALISPRAEAAQANVGALVAEVRPTTADPWSKAAGAVDLDDENEAARRKRIQRLMLSRRESFAGNGSMRVRSSMSGAARPGSSRMSISGAINSAVSRAKRTSCSGGAKSPRQSSAGVAFATKPTSNSKQVDTVATASHTWVPKEPSRNGVCLTFLQTLAGLVYSELGEEDAHRLSTAEVIKRYIASRTRAGEAFLDQLPHAAVSTPRYLVSHRWNGAFLGLVTSLTRHFQDHGNPDPDRTFLWLDFLAIDQHTLQDPEMLVEVVAEVSRCVQHTLLVLDTEGTALNRTWMLFEMWCATHNQFPANNKLMLVAEGQLRATPLMSELYQGIDLLRSETTRETEKDVILDYIKHAVSGKPRMVAPHSMQHNGGKSHKPPVRRRSRLAAMLAIDMTATNKGLQSSLLECCMRDAKRATKMLTTPNLSPTSYIDHMVHAAVMMQLSGRAPDAERILRKVVEYQISGQQGSVAQLVQALLALVDSLAAQHKSREALVVIRMAYDTAESALGPGHHATIHLGIRLWDILNTAGQATYLHVHGLLQCALQHQAADSLASALYARLAGQPIDYEDAFGIRRFRQPKPGQYPAGLQPEHAAVMLALGYSRLNLNKLSDANYLFNAVLASYQDMLWGLHHPRCIEVMLALGRTATAMNAYGEAVSWYTQARALLVHWYSRESPKWVQACCDQAACLTALGDLRLAEKMIRRLLAPPLRLKMNGRLTNSGGLAPAADISSVPATNPVADSNNNNNSSNSNTESVADAEAAEDQRLGGMSFEVHCRLVEILSAKAVASTSTAADNQGSGDQQLPTSDGVDDVSQALNGGSQFEGGNQRTLQASSSQRSSGKAQKMYDTVMRKAHKQQEVRQMSEAETCMQEATFLATKLLDRYKRFVAEKNNSANHHTAGLPKILSKNKSIRVLAKQDSPGARTSGKPAVKPLSLPPLAKSISVPITSQTSGTAAARGAQTHRHQSNLMRLAAAQHEAATKELESKLSSKLSKNSDHGPDVEQKVGPVDRSVTLRNLLLNLRVVMSGESVRLKEAKELYGALDASLMALRLADELQGCADSCCIDALVQALDLLMHARKFNDAKELLVKYRDHPDLPMGTKEILRHAVEQCMTAHAFESAEQNDAGKVVWALELGCSTHRGLERLLVIAASLGHYEVSAAIVSVAPTTSQEEEGTNGLRALGVAACLGFTPIVSLLIQLPHISVDATDWHGRTGLWHASNSGQYECVCQLLEQGHANPNTKDIDSITPLHAAAAAGHLAVIQVLLEKGAAAEAVDSHGRTPLMTAAMEGQAEAADLLLRCHARANTTDKDGTTALMLASVYGQLDSAIVLLSHKCEIDFHDSLGQTALFKAAAQGASEIVEVLLMEGSNIDALDKEGRTPLHLAAQGGHANAVVRLLTFLVRGKDAKGSIVQSANFGGSNSGMDVFTCGVRNHIRIRVEQVLKMKGWEKGTRGQCRSDNTEGVKKLGFDTGANGSMADPGYGNDDYDDDGDARGRLSRRASCLSQSSANGIDHDPAKDYDELRLLLAYAHLPQVRQFCKAPDRYGVTAADLASEPGHTQLARLLRMFMKKPGAASGLEQEDDDDDDDASPNAEQQAEKAPRLVVNTIPASVAVTGNRSMCNTPSAVSPSVRPLTGGGLFGKVLIGTKIPADIDIPPPRPSYNGVVARKSLLNMAAEFDM